VQWPERPTGTAFFVTGVGVGARFIAESGDGVDRHLTVRRVDLFNSLDQRVDEIERGHAPRGEAQQYVVNTEVAQGPRRGMRIVHAPRL
jgi:hypothetical protein